MRTSARSPFTSSMGRFGFLFADLFAVLAMIFLLANTVGHYVPPTRAMQTPTFTPTPAPLICGLQHTAGFDNRSNAFPVDAALGNNDSAAISAFQKLAHAAFLPYSQKHIAAGYVLIWGLAPDVGAGDSLAAGAEVALQNLATEKFVFSHAGYQPLWDGNDYNAAVGDAVALEVFFFTTSVNGKSCS